MPAERSRAWWHLARGRRRSDLSGSRSSGSDELGEIAVRRDGPAVIFDFGEWKSEVASSRNPDGSVSFRAVDAGIWGFGLEFVVSDGEKRALKLRDGQHEYTFTEK